MIARMSVATHIPPDVLADSDPMLFNALIQKLGY